MIFVTVGTHSQQFNRLLKELDELRLRGKITENIFAQTGHSDFKPKSFSYQKFLSQQVFEKKIKEASVVISHAGAGAIINSLKYQKKLVLVPRLKEFKEHTDSHQIDLAGFLQREKKALAVFDIKDLCKKINAAKNFAPKKTRPAAGIVLALNSFFGVK